MNKRKNILFLTLSAGLIFIMVGCMIILMTDTVASSKNKITTEYVTTIYQEESESKTWLSELQKINPDTMGWLDIPQINLNSVVVQRNDVGESESDYYYLKHDFYGKPSKYGVLFFDPKNSVSEDSVSQNLIVYGHNMKDGQMFGKLKNFKDKTFCVENPYLYLETANGEGTYRVFSVAIVSTKSSELDYIAYRTEFKSEDDFQEYCNQLKSKSLFDLGVKVNSDDHILTLSTCVGNSEDLRLIVCAKKLTEPIEIGNW